MDTRRAGGLLLALLLTIAWPHAAAALSIAYHAGTATTGYVIIENQYGDDKPCHPY